MSPVNFAPFYLSSVTCYTKKSWLIESSDIANIAYMDRNLELLDTSCICLDCFNKNLPKSRYLLFIEVNGYSKYWIKYIMYCIAWLTDLLRSICWADNPRAYPTMAETLFRLLFFPTDFSSHLPQISASFCILWIVFLGEEWNKN